MPIPQSTLNALIAHIREQGSYILASPEDADYFRKTLKKTQSSKPEPKLAAIAPPIKAEIVPKSESFKPVSIPGANKVEIAPKSDSFKPVSIPGANKVEAVPNSEPIKPASLRKATLNFTQIRNVMSIVAPELAILEEIPNDQLAKKLSERWKTKNQTAPISILTYQEPGEQRALLEEIAKAVDIYFGPAKLVNAEKIEKEKQWETFLSVEGLKMVIVCDYTLWQLGNLMHFYKETPAQGARMLGSVPIFLLPDLSLYLKDALLKRSLWKALCQKCS